MQRGSAACPPALSARSRREQGDTGTRSVTRQQRNSLQSSVTSQDTENLCWSGVAAAFISAQTSIVHSLDILRAKLTFLQCVVCAHARVEVERAEQERAQAVSEREQAEEQSTAETPAL